MESEKDRLSLIYDKLLGGGGSASTPDAVPPTPEGIDFSDMQGPAEFDHGGARPAPPAHTIRLQIQDAMAALDGTGAVLSGERLKTIMVIVAEQVAEDAAAQLKEWRQKYALREEE
jgi:hypothetical protein